MKLIAGSIFIFLLPLFFLVSCGATETAVTIESLPTPNSSATSIQPSASRGPIPTISESSQEVATLTPFPPLVESTAAPASAVPSIELFSLSTANQVAPDDILQEIAFATGGDADTGCLGAFTQPTIVSVVKDASLHELVEIGSCGWQNNERIDITITFPDGKITSQEQIFQQFNASEFIFNFKTTVLSDPPGSYHIVFAGSSGTIDTSIVLHEPSGPHFYWNEDGTLLLYNFQPREGVRIFAYTAGGSGFNVLGERSYQLHAWQEFNVNQYGILEINPYFDVPIDWYAAIGDYSGEIRPLYPSSPPVWGIYSPTIFALDLPTSPPNQETWPISDTGVEACHLSSGDIITAAENARLWSQPDATSAIVILSPTVGQKLTLSVGPIWGRIRADINASGWWWQVTTSDDEQGWLWQDRIAECKE